MNRVRGVLSSLAILNYLRKSYYEPPKRSARRWWVRPSNQNRETEGFFETEYKLLRERDPEYFFKSVRMIPVAFDILLSRVRPRLEKFSFRKPIDPECRLFLTLMYLAHGSSVFMISNLFRIGESTVRDITQEVCEVLWSSLAGDYMPEVQEEEWSRHSEDFFNMWNFPHCCAAVDGKHIAIQCPANAGSTFFNYKSFHSIVLMGMCDAQYNFVAVDVGAFGGNSDGGVFSNSEFGNRLLNGRLGLPCPAKLPGSDIVLPFFIVGDAAFPLKDNIMRPYPGVNLPPLQDNFNMRLSRARRTIENAFGISVARWRILKNTLFMSPESAEKIVKAAVILHNFVKRHCPGEYSPSNFVDHVNEEGITTENGEWRSLVDPLESVDAAFIQRGNNAKRSAYKIRDTIAEYVLNNAIH